MSSRKKIFKGIIILEILAILVLIFPLVAGCWPCFFVIQSDSMNPMISKGDVVFVKNKNQNISDYKNEVIAFYNPLENRIIVHRAIDIKNGYLLTKGDNSPLADFYSPSEKEVVGIYWFKIPGKFMPFK